MGRFLLSINARDSIKDSESVHLSPNAFRTSKCKGKDLTLSFVPLCVEAQQTKKTPRIGFLGVSSSSAYSGYIDAFRKGLRDLGYMEGQNIAIEYLYGDGKSDRRPDLSG